MIRDDAEEVIGSFVWPACVDACVETVLKCLTERETRRGQKQKLLMAHMETSWS